MIELKRICETSLRSGVPSARHIILHVQVARLCLVESRSKSTNVKNVVGVEPFMTENELDDTICVLEIGTDPVEVIETTLERLRAIAYTHDLRVRLVADWCD